MSLAFWRPSSSRYVYTSSSLRIKKCACYSRLLGSQYGGAFLALLTSLYMGYDPTAGPISVLVGTLYTLIAGARCWRTFGLVYNSFVERF
jgi:hypothetical protein